MKVLINLLKFIVIAILTICIVVLGFISIASLTILDKNYIIQKLDENNFYSEMYNLVESNFENYIYQSGLDEEVIKNICTEEKIKKDINAMISNIYDGTEQNVDTKEIEDNLNYNIEKSGIKNNQNESAIKQFVEHICNEYTSTIVHTKYENEINKIYQKVLENLNSIYRIVRTIFALDIIAIIAINKKNISKDLQYFGIGLLAASLFELNVWQIIITKIDIKGVKIFNDVFSKSIVSIIQDIIKQIVSLSLGTIVIGLIFLSIYAARYSIKMSKNTEETNTTK